MAKVTVDYDTVEKTCILRINGTEISDVEYVEFSKRYDIDGRAYMRLTKRTPNQDGMTTYVSVEASKK